MIDNLTRQGFNDILLLAGYQSEVVLEFITQHACSNLSVRCLVEETPLGTGGALRNAREHLAEHFVLLNGDTLFDIDLNNLVVPPMNECLARVALRRVPDTSRFGRIVLSGNKVTAMQEKGYGGEGLINGGIYFLAKACLNFLPLSPYSLENDLFPLLITEEKIEGREYDGFFIDIGIPADFDAAQRLVAELF